MAIPFEFIILSSSIALYTSRHHEPQVDDPFGGPIRDNITPWELYEVIVIFVRFAILLSLASTFATVKLSRGARRILRDRRDEMDEESSLLDPHQRQNGNANGHAYGTQNSTSKHEGDQDAWAKPKEVPAVNWFQYLRGYRVFFPYLWPAKSFKLQLIALVCFTLVVVQRAINVLVPIQVGIITNTLAGEEGQAVRIPWLSISFYVVLRWIQGPQGLLAALRGYLWVPVSQYAYRELSTAAFQHVHGLSLDFHLGKKTGEVISALNKGNAINTFLEQVTFSLGPMVFDLIVAVVYLGIKFDIYLSLVVGIVTFFYIYITIRIAQWRQEVRRQMVDADRQEDAVK